MRLRASWPLHMLGLGVVRCASWLVPQAERVAWRMEWGAELWHVREVCTPARGVSWAAEREVAAFLLGAFEDARCLRKVESGARQGWAMGSAGRCVFTLMVMLAAVYGAALLLPGAFVALHPPRYENAGRLVLIQSSMAASDMEPTISAEQYNVWRSRQRRLFDGFAFYQVTRQRLQETSGKIVKAKVAVASPELFPLLGAETVSMDATQDGALPVVLSSRLWRGQFGSERAIAGREFSMGGQRLRVVGVMPEGFWRLPGTVDAWVLMPDSQLPPGSIGYVVGLVTATGRYPHWSNSWEMTAPLPNGNSGEFLCVSLADRIRGPLGLFLFAVVLALLALPATTSLPLGEYRGAPQRMSWGTRLRRWSFLGSKLVLLFPMVYFASVDLAHVATRIDPIASEYIQLLAAFSLCLFGLRWVLRDQRERCPVCLRKLTNPARVGHPSRNFLAWNGTELICTVGHGLLHVPEIETSWFSTQRWLYLDPSWEILFAEQGVASGSYF